MSNVSRGPKFVADPVLKAARARQAFSDSQVLANPSFTATDDFISVVGAKALGVALDPETGRMPNVAADEELEVAVSADRPELDSTELARQADLERIAALEEQLAALSSEDPMNGEGLGRLPSRRLGDDEGIERNALRLPGHHLCGWPGGRRRP